MIRHLVIWWSGGSKVLAAAPGLAERQGGGCLVRAVGSCGDGRMKRVGGVATSERGLQGSVWCPQPFLCGNKMFLVCLVALCAAFLVTTSDQLPQRMA